MSVTLVVNSAPYGSEGPYNALRLAQALLARGEWVDLFLMGDGVHAARASQDPRGAHASLEAMIREALEKGAQVTLCGTCCQTRGLDEHDAIPGVHLGTVHDLAALVVKSDRVISFWRPPVGFGGDE
jgi:uncharacterized protein involved in oxidation of intracellular sulfur